RRDDRGERAAAAGAERSPGAGGRRCRVALRAAAAGRSGAYGAADRPDLHADGTGAPPVRRRHQHARVIPAGRRTLTPRPWIPGTDRIGRVGVMVKQTVATVALVATVTAAVSAQAPAQRPGDAEQVRLRQRISTMEAVLARAVQNGADMVLRQVSN